MGKREGIFFDVSIVKYLGGIDPTCKYPQKADSLKIEFRKQKEGLNLKTDTDEKIKIYRDTNHLNAQGAGAWKNSSRHLS